MLRGCLGIFQIMMMNIKRKTDQRDKTAGTKNVTV